MMSTAAVAAGTRADDVKPQPFFKWAGGKRQLLPALRASLPAEWNRYHEVFVGGGALFFDLALEAPNFRLHAGAVLSDANAHVIATYRAIQADPDAVLALLAEWVWGPDQRWKNPPTPKSPDAWAAYMSHLSAIFASLRSEEPLDSLGRGNRDVYTAAWFLFLNRTGFNGMYRVNQSGRFNVPFGKFASPPPILQPEILRSASKALRGVTLRCASYAESMSSAVIRSGDLVYLDPPYAPVSKTSDFTSYTAGGFDRDDQEALTLRAQHLVERGVHVRATNSACERTRELWRKAGFCEIQLSARRSVNSNVKKRGSVAEYLFVPQKACTPGFLAHMNEALGT